MEEFRIPKEVQFVLNRLNTAGHEAFCVGGCVRDTLLGLSPADWDVTTNALPDTVKACFPDCRLVETGIKHGTVTILVNELPIEATTYRADGVYRDHRHPEQVAFSSRLEDDLARRDFTVNAMAYQPKQGLVDVFGGKTDLRAALLRCVGDPARRFEEDALRILRCLRFSATLGFSIEAGTDTVLREKRELLSFISRERICEELLRLLEGRDAEQTLRQYSEVIFPLLPKLLPMSKRRIRHLLGTLGETRFFALLDLMEPQDGAVKEARSCAREIIAREKALRRQELAITGRDLLAMGIPPGPELGAILKLLDELVRDGKIENERAGLLEAAEQACKK